MTQTPLKPMSELTWLRVGGPADVVFQPASIEDLCATLKDLPNETEVFPLGVGSNLIVRDGGHRAFVVRLGRGFNGIRFDGAHVIAGAAALEDHVARKAADQGLDLAVLRTIPGSIGGAVRMNAGCYGSYTVDHFVSAQAVTRAGDVVTLSNSDMGFGYRQTELPSDMIFTEVTVAAAVGDPESLHARRADQLAKRDASQPTKARSAGSTFRIPAGFSSTGRSDDVHDLKAWKLIDDAGLRGHRVGGAQMSEKHSNFMINCGDAKAQDLESLGEFVRKRVYENSGLTLEWEIMRVGEPAPKEGEQAS